MDQVCSDGVGTLGWENLLFSSSLRIDLNLFSVLEQNHFTHLMKLSLLVTTVGLFFSHFVELKKKKKSKSM